MTLITNSYRRLTRDRRNSSPETQRVEKVKSRGHDRGEVGDLPSSVVVNHSFHNHVLSSISDVNFRGGIELRYSQSRQRLN